jgi:hypothetical protein
MRPRSLHPVRPDRTRRRRTVRKALLPGTPAGLLRKTPLQAGSTTAVPLLCLTTPIQPAPGLGRPVRPTLCDPVCPLTHSGYHRQPIYLNPRRATPVAAIDPLLIHGVTT